ncbi:MAG: GNAT family N-acetyltransferase [Bacteroidaceae bacterium]|nr:GNAT family N-acetyltransferase [Bacteroidaceae bacterium]
MSELIVSPVKGRKELKAFVRFNYELYKDCEYAVPDFLEGTMDTFNPKKNPAFRFCEAEFFLARREGKIVGRVAGIINHRANETWHEKHVRFGWIDFINDLEVSAALLRAVEEWGRERGMTHIVGPLGFTDMDLEGMLTDGYDQLSTMNSIYNYPYYPEHMAKLGYQKEVGWVERKVIIPREGHEANQEKYFKVAELVKRRYGFRIRKFKSKKEIRREGYIPKVLGVVNRAYANLYGYSEMDEAQMEVYAKEYLMFLDKRYLSVVETAEGEVIGMGICITSLSRALQKAKCKLFPFGWFHLAKALWFNRHPEVLDMLLVGILPEYQDKGANALIFADLIPEGTKDGYIWAESHHQLEDNTPSQAQWKNLECTIHKRRAAFGKDI